MFNPRSNHTKDSKIVLNAALLNTQLYKVRIKGKVEQSREWSMVLPYGEVAIEKGAFGSSVTTVANFTNYNLFRFLSFSLRRPMERQKFFSCY